MNAVATAGGIALLPVALGALAVKREWRVGLGERFGALAPTPPDRDAIWIHGASVGELTARRSHRSSARSGPSFRTIACSCRA
jgi:3-deoxy-D-manno-octulosonic-acid transferase